MARAKFRDVAVVKVGTAMNVIPNAEVTVYEAGTSDPLAQTIYADISSGVTLPNPFITDTDGNIEFFLNFGQRVRLVVTGTGLGTADLDYETVLYDVSNPSFQTLALNANSSGYALSVTQNHADNKLFELKDNLGAQQVRVDEIDGSNIAFYAQRGSFGNVPASGSTFDFAVSHNRLTGAPTGSFVPSIFAYHSASQPTGGFGSGTGVPDEVTISMVAFARNIASGASQQQDGGLRCFEAQTIIYASTGNRDHYAAEFGCYSAQAKLSVHDVGGPTAGVSRGDGILLLLSLDQTANPSLSPSFGTSVILNYGIALVGNMGYKHAIYLENTAGTKVWHIDGSGNEVVGNVIPNGSSKINGNITAGQRWAQVWSDLITVNNGSASSPAVGVGLAGTEGLSGVSQTSLSLSVNLHEILKLKDTDGSHELNGSILFKSKATPSTPAADHADVFLGTDGYMYHKNTAGRLLAVSADDRHLLLYELLRQLTGVVAIYLPKITDTTTSVDESSIHATITHNTSIASRIVQQGRGIGVTYASASTQYSSMVDQSYFSFGNGATDSAWTIFSLATISNTGAQKTLASKYDTVASAREWIWGTDASNKIQLQLTDQSAATHCTRTTDAALHSTLELTQPTLYAMSSTGTKATGVTIYVNGVGRASTAANDISGTYTAMESLSSGIEFGAYNAHAAGKFDGTQFIHGLVPSVLDATGHAALAQIIAWYYNLAII